ncbi:hypothetical protein GCM10008917_19230 [Paraclostridium tenue]|uniref:Uncharacterized protein n=1 Tax=Paraclostridium tenue TaxID=1737 RepID=A0ABN1M5W6_9FIRM
MIKLIVYIIISIIILSMAYSIGIKKRLNLISLLDENKLKNKTYSFVHFLLNFPIL